MSNVVTLETRLETCREERRIEKRKEKLKEAGNNLMMISSFKNIRMTFSSSRVHQEPQSDDQGGGGP